VAGVPRQRRRAPRVLRPAGDRGARAPGRRLGAGVRAHAGLGPRHVPDRALRLRAVHDQRARLRSVPRPRLRPGRRRRRAGVSRLDRDRAGGGDAHRRVDLRAARPAAGAQHRARQLVGADRRDPRVPGRAPGLLLAAGGGGAGRGRAPRRRGAVRRRRVPAPVLRGRRRGRASVADRGGRVAGDALADRRGDRARPGAVRARRLQPRLALARGVRERVRAAVDRVPRRHQRRLRRGGDAPGRGGGRRARADAAGRRRGDLRDRDVLGPRRRPLRRRRLGVGSRSGVGGAAVAGHGGRRGGGVRAARPGRRAAVGGHQPRAGRALRRRRAGDRGEPRARRRRDRRDHAAVAHHRAGGRDAGRVPLRLGHHRLDRGRGQRDARRAGQRAIRGVGRGPPAGRLRRARAAGRRRRRAALAFVQTWGAPQARRVFGWLRGGLGEARRARCSRGPG
jgi:hypothetical protein